MILKLNNGYLIPVTDGSTTSLVVCDSADTARMEKEAFEHIEFRSDDASKLYGKYDDVYPSFLISGTRYVWYEDELIRESDVPEPPAPPEPEPIEPEVTVSLEERVNDLEVAVCEIVDSMAEV